MLVPECLDDVVEGAPDVGDLLIPEQDEKAPEERPRGAHLLSRRAQRARASVVGAEQLVRTVDEEGPHFLQDLPIMPLLARLKARLKRSHALVTWPIATAQPWHDDDEALGRVTAQGAAATASRRGAFGGSVLRHAGFARSGRPSSPRRKTLAISSVIGRSAKRS